MFSKVSVILFGGPHVTISHDAMDMGPPSYAKQGTYPPPLVLKSGGHHWRPFQTYAVEGLSPPTSTDI